MPVPAHTGLLIAPPKWLKAVRVLHLVAHERQLDRPVVRQVQRAPLRVVKFSLGESKLAGLGEVALSVSKAQVAGRVAAMAELELPAEIEEQLLARSHRRQRFGRCRIGITRQQRGRAPPGRPGH